MKLLKRLRVNGDLYGLEVKLVLRVDIQTANGAFLVLQVQKIYLFWLD